MNMREPSIHISYKNLVLVLDELLTVTNSPVKWNNEKLAKDILIRGKNYSLTHRQLKVDKAKLLKSTNKVVLSTRDDAGVFAQLLNLIRKQKKHKGINIIKVGSKDWLMVKEVVSLANEFCNEFELPREEGYKVYINTALDKMSKFNLSRFNIINQSVFESYEAKQKIKLDITPNQTLQIKAIYDKCLGEKTAIVNTYNLEPEKFIFFIKAKEEAIKHGISFEHYIKAQFKGLEWCNSYPEPSQLIGKGSIDRLNKYLIENKINRFEIKKRDNLEEVARMLKDKMKKNKKK